MTRARDEYATARDARAVALGRAAIIAADLAAIPGWLLVGDPSRLADPADRAQAESGIGLRSRLDEIHSGIAALDAELDALDGVRTDSFFLFREWSRWLPTVPDGQTLLDELTPDPRRAYLGPSVAMTLDTAQRIVDVVAANGGRVGDGDTFVRDARLVDEDVFDLDQTARIRLDPLIDGHSIGVLLPMRLETRYRRPVAPGDSWRLRVRVHPDPVALAAPAAPPSRQEADMVATLWSRAGGDIGTDVGAAAFTPLAGSVGGGRAAYLLRTVTVVPDGAAFVVAGDYDDQGRGFDYRAALPEALQLWGDAGTGVGLQLLGELHPDLAEIAAQGAIDTAMADLTPEQVPELWWTSFAVAERVGLATEVELPDGPHLDVLLVSGLSDSDPRDAVRNHADNATLGLITPMSPTNTVSGAPTDDTGRDAARWLEVARATGSGTASGVAGVLTGRPRLDGVAPISTALSDVVPALITALWPVLWQRWLKDVENADRTRELGDWAARNLAPLGTWPAFRVGDVPYGILPAVDIPNWRAAPHDAEFEDGIITLVGGAVSGWADAAVAGGTAAGADPERLLDIIGRVPTSRRMGTRDFVPLEVVALLGAAVNGTDPRAVIAAWDDRLAPLLDHEPVPMRRYQPFGYVHPTAEGRQSLRETLAGYLDSEWEMLSHFRDERQLDVPLLARLIRHSLLLTQAEVSRLADDPWAVWTRGYLLPLSDAEQLARDGSMGGRVSELPQYAQDRLDSENPPNADAVAIVRQFTDVRNAVRSIIDRDSVDTALVDGGALWPAVTAVIDTSSHRIDPWITGVGTRRLRRLIARGVPRRLGAYGWVDNLDPAIDPTPPTTAGLLHAPGYAQALTAAVLRDHAVHEDDDRWRITARSDLVRLAARIGGDVRLGVHLSESLGREIERRAGDPAAVLELRRTFPARPEWAGRRVCDGQRVLDAPAGSVPAAVGPLDDLREVLDTYGDLLVADAVHDVVSGRIAAAQESMDAAAGLSAPPELRVLRTQRQGFSVRTTVLVALPIGESDPGSPVTIADPCLAGLLESETGPASTWTWTRNGSTVSLADLGLGAPDTVLIAQPTLDRLAGLRLGGPATGGSAGERRAMLDRLCSLLDAQRGLPDLAAAAGAAGAGDAGAGELRTRLTELRSIADELSAGLAADPPGITAALVWGLVADPSAAEVGVAAQALADQLAARILAAGDPATDTGADAATLSDRIRALLTPASGLPLICSGVLPDMSAAPDLDRGWLEVVAAVRPAVARLEAHQLGSPWPATASDPARIWSVPSGSERRVIAYGPGVDIVGPVGVALLDDWAETVPSRKHTTHGAFGFDAPRARAQQAVLIAVPPDEQVPITADALPSIVLSTRSLARARMAQPDGLGAWSIAVPTSMVLASGPAGSDLQESL